MCWLGTEFKPPGRSDLDLVLSDVWTLDESGDDKQTYAVVQYSRAVGEEPSVVVQQYTPERWQSIAETGGGPSWHRESCAERTPRSGLGVTAVLIAAHARHDAACSEPHDLFVVHIEFPETIVEVHSHMYWPLNGETDVYASPEAIEIAARALVRR